MRLSVRRTLRTLALTSTLAAACGSSPQAVPVVETDVPGTTATFGGLQLTMTRANYGWMPSEGPLLGPDPVRMTVFVRVLNVGSGPRSIEPSELRLRTWNRTYPYDPPHNTPTWPAVAGGREPAFHGGSLGTAEAIEGWLTYEVPRDEVYADAFEWRPRRDRVLRMEFPRSALIRFCGATRVFGTVTDISGNPVPGAEVDVFHWDLSASDKAFEAGRCTGEPTGKIPAVTGEDGRYAAEGLWRWCDQRCFEAGVTAPPGSGLGDARTVGGVVIPGTPHPMIEPSELRLDAVLPAE